MDVEAGLKAPLPWWVGIFDLAKRIGVRVTRAESLEDVERWVVMAASVLAEAEGIVHREREREQKQQARRRR